MCTSPSTPGRISTKAPLLVEMVARPHGRERVAQELGVVGLAFQRDRQRGRVGRDECEDLAADFEHVGLRPKWVIQGGAGPVEQVAAQGFQLHTGRL